MKKIAFALIAALCLTSTVGSADQLTTTFEVRYSVNGNIFQAPIPTPVGKCWLLPADLAGWECAITDKFLSRDGKSAYHNIYCKNINTNVFVGTSIQCSLESEDFSEKGFFLRAKDGTDLQTSARCQTKKISEKKSSKSDTAL